jgi:thiol-disulfide isomerase/thioredoxin
MKLYFFKAPWCSACHAIEQYVPENYEHIDCSTEGVEIANEYHVVSLPCFLAVDDEKHELGRIQTTSIPQLEHWRKGLENG